MQLWDRWHGGQMHQVTHGQKGRQCPGFQQQAQRRFHLGFAGRSSQVQDANILLVGSLGPIGEQPIIGQAEGGRGKEFIAVLVGGEGSRLALKATRSGDGNRCDACACLPDAAG